MSNNRREIGLTIDYESIKHIHISSNGISIELNNPQQFLNYPALENDQIQNGQIQNGQIQYIPNETYYETQNLITNIPLTIEQPITQNNIISGNPIVEEHVEPQELQAKEIEQPQPRPKNVIEKFDKHKLRDRKLLKVRKSKKLIEASEPKIHKKTNHKQHKIHQNKSIFTLPSFDIPKESIDNMEDKDDGNKGMSIFNINSIYGI